MKEGDKASDFSLKDSEGKIRKLSDYKGKKIILYFYPKDDTPGCAKEACGFRDNFKLLSGKNLMVLGISKDSSESHKKFKKKYKLPFILLADTEKEVAQNYGVWKEKNFMGRKYMGIERTTFLIDEEGKIKKIFSKVRPDGHAEKVLEVI